MKSNSKNFFKALFTLTIFLTGLALLMVKYFPDLLSINQHMLMIGFLVTVISLVHLVLLKVSEGKPQKFIRVFMIATMAKLIVYLLFILSMAYYFREQAAGLLIGFMILYICYTALEVVFLRRHLESQ